MFPIDFYDCFVISVCMPFFTVKHYCAMIKTLKGIKTESFALVSLSK